jgi:hypothetical protein
MLKKILMAAVGSALIMTGCASVKFSERNTIIVIAKEAKLGEGPTGISDKFSFEGKIVVHTTFRWEDINTQGGQQTIEVRWFSGEKLMSSAKNTFRFGKSPYYVWFNTTGTALGVGKAKVEVYADGVFVGSKNFEVVEKL